MTHSVLAPTQAGERFEILDVVRGLALFGIVTANMALYSLYAELPDAAIRALPTNASDRVLDFLELLLIEGKFYTIFSVLFGLGFAVLLSRASAKKLSFHRFYLRRALFLYAIGVAHAVLLWHDDILEAYAFCGILLLPAVGVRNRSLLALALLALLAPVAIQLAGGMPTGALHDAQQALFDRFGFSRDTKVEIWAHGSVGDIVRLNLSTIPAQVSFLLRSGMIFKIYGCFLLGLYLGRNELHTKLQSMRPVLTRLAIGGLAVGLPLNAVYAATFESGSWTETLSGTFGILPLSAAYVALCCLAWLGDRGATGFVTSRRSAGWRSPTTWGRASSARWCSTGRVSGWVGRWGRRCTCRSDSACTRFRCWPAGCGSIASGSGRSSGCGGC